MKFRTPFFLIEIESIFLIVIFLSIFSNVFRNYMCGYYICYLFILFHEFSHIFVAAILGKEMEVLKFSISGVNIKFKYKTEKYIYNIGNILIYIIGPISNLILAIVFYNNKMIFEINIFLALINLLPIYPLDGYNILKFIIYYFLNKKIGKKLLNLINNIVFIFLGIVAFFQIIYLNNPSVVLLFIYLFFINKANKINKNV